MKTIILLLALVLALPATAQDHARHDAAMAAIRNVKATVSFTTGTNTATTSVNGVVTSTTTTTTVISGPVGSDPIPGCPLCVIAAQP